MCYAQNPSHKNNTGGPERATSPQRRRPENGRGKEKKKTIPWHRTFPCTHGALRPQTLQMFTTTSTPQTTNQTNFSLSSTPPRSNQRKSDQKQKSWSGACRALRPRRRRAGRSHMPRLRIRASSFSSSSRPPTSSSSCRHEAKPHASAECERRVCLTACPVPAAGAITGKARTNGGEPLAHLGSQEEPIRDALELVRVVDLLATSPRSPATHAQKGGKKYHELRSVVD